MAITCCHGCVPPKRTPTCKFDGTCNQYAEQKAKHDADRKARQEADRVSYGIYEAKSNRVRKALKSRSSRRKR